jgi:outer membrane protein assembly factor BamB
MIALVLTCGVMGLATSSRGDDWPGWGGPQRDLAWRETGIIKKFSTDGLLPRVWSTPIGEGYSGPAVANGRVFITDRQARKHTERIVCLDAKDGEVLWTHEYECRYTISYPAGPRSTPVVDSGRVYTLGAMGHLFCNSADHPGVQWQKNFVDDYQTTLPTWGMVPSPLVDGNQLITLVGGPDALVVSFDKGTGEELWRALDDKDVGYAPPMIFTFGGMRQLIVWHPAGVSALNPDNGKLYWHVPFKSQAGLTIATPRQIGNQLFVTTFYNGPLMIEVADDGRSAKVAWKGNSDSEVKTDGLHSIISTPVVTEAGIYGVCSYGQLRGLDVRTGKRLWETTAATGSGRWWNAFLIPHEDRYFLHNEQGDLIIAQLSPQGYEELSRAKLVEPTREVGRRMTIWSHPAFAMKSVFARNDKEIVRVNLAAE